MTSSSFSVLAGHDQGLDAAIQLGREHVVALADVLKRDAVRHDVAGFQIAVLDVGQQPGPLSLHRGLVHAQRQPLFKASPNLTALKIGPYAPITETVPPLRTESMAQFSAIGDPPCNFSLAELMCCIRLPSASAPAASMTTSLPR